MDTFDFPDLDVDEPRRLDHATKKDKRDAKDANYVKQKVVKREKFTAKRKEKKLLIQSQFESEEARVAYFDMKKQERFEKRCKAKEAMGSALTIIIDCGFEELMDEREIRSLAKQLGELYIENRLRAHPAALRICGVSERLRVYLDEQGFKNWSIHWQTEQIYDGPGVTEDAIYLTPDAEEELTEVQGNETFIVGGLVDRTIVKNATLYRSRGLGVRACRLPISHLIKPNFKKALNVCTAALMIPEYLTHRDWERTFNEIVPKKFTQ